MCLIYRLVNLQAQDSKGINPISSKLCKNALLNSLISKTALLRQNKHFFSNINFEIATPGGTISPMGTNFFTQFFTHNFDISISHRELTLYTIQIHIYRPLDFTHINNSLKSFSVNYNAAPQLFAKHSSFQYKL